MIYQELLRRHFDPEKFKVWIDYENDLATFPLYGVSGRLLGYQQYNPKSTSKKSNTPRDSRYYTYHSGIRETMEGVVWGLDVISPSDTLFVTEGVFEAARVNKEGRNAVAILTSCPPQITITNLYGLGYSRLVWCGDNDHAGRTSKVIKMVDDVLHFDVDLDEVEHTTLIGGLNGFD